MVKNRSMISLIIYVIAGMSLNAQNLLYNGSFEDPVIPANSASFTTPTGWQSTGQQSLANGLFGANYPLPEDGSQYITIGTDGSGLQNTLSQTFTNSTSGTYLLTWFDANPSGFDSFASPYSVTVFTSVNQIVVTTNLDAQHHVNGWFSNSVWVALSPGIYTLNFRSTVPPSGLSALIDNVSLLLFADNNDLVTTISLAADISWAGRTNQFYQVQYISSLAGTNWLDLGSPVSGTGTNSAIDIINDQKRFYRVIHFP